MSAVLREIRKAIRSLSQKPIPGVFVEPKEDDIRTWLVNFLFFRDSSEYPGLLLHLHLHFTDDFPSMPPHVRLYTHFPVHSHVYEERICFTLIEDFREFFEQTATPSTAFWNPSLSIRYFLEKLYDFLGHDYDREKSYTEDDRRAVIAHSRGQECACGHRGLGSPRPTISDTAIEKDRADRVTPAHEASEAPEESTGAPGAPDTPDVPDAPDAQAADMDGSVGDLNAYVAQLLDVEPDSVPPEALASARSLVCFATHRIPRVLGDGDDGDTDADSPHDMICFPLCANLYGRGLPMARGVVARVGITSDFSVVSRSAVESLGLFVTDLGNPMTDAFPFVVSPVHWERTEARAFASAKIAEILSRTIGGDEDSDDEDTETLRERFQLSLPSAGACPQLEDVLNFFGEVWKNLSVALMNGHECVSERVLTGYCALHHLALRMADDNPDLADHCVQIVREFCESPRHRHRRAVPDLGRFLFRFVLSPPAPQDGSWAVAAPLVIRELFARNHRWILTAARSEESLHALNARSRLNLSWEQSAVGIRLTAFQVKFILRFGGRALPDYNRSLGAPTPEMLRDFLEETKRIQALASFPAFFEEIDYVPPRATPEETARWSDLDPAEQDTMHLLLEAENDSAHQQYHRSTK